MLTYPGCSTELISDAILECNTAVAQIAFYQIVRLHITVLIIR